MFELIDYSTEESARAKFSSSNSESVARTIIVAAQSLRQVWKKIDSCQAG
jgi:hypothetical protein